MPTALAPLSFCAPFHRVALAAAVAFTLLVPSFGAAQQAPPVAQTESPNLATPAPDAGPILPTQMEPAPLRPAIPLVTDNAIPQQAAAQPVLPHADYSPWGMYQAAHWVVKAVMILLAFASFVTWTVLIYKLVELAIARRRAAQSVKTIQDAGSLESASDLLATRRDPAAFMARAALVEYRRSDGAIAAAGPEGVKERTRSVLSRVEVQAGSRIRRGTGVLATIGATAPFVGLFGTVWGIMNSFIGIAETKTTNLAVVAPGIAEALLATAIGLVAAIPAVVIYNHFSRQIAQYRQSLGDASAGVERLLSRDLDFQRAARTGA